MKRALTWFAGVIGIAAAGRLLSRHRHRTPDVPEIGAERASDPATELRERLAAQRAPKTDDAPSPPEETLDERRARIHAKAREAIDSMGDGGGSAA